MQKWIIRLIGALFILQALPNSIRLVSGIAISTSGKTIEINICAWLWNIFLVYIGYELVRFRERGRRLALFIMWPTVVILSSLFAFVIGVLIAKAIYPNLSISPAPINLFSTTYEVNSPGYVLLLGLFGVGIPTFYASGIYFLSRKDTKMLFQKTKTIQEAI